MTATVHPLPTAPLVERRIYHPSLLGKRVLHRHYEVYGRLSGDVRVDRGCVWLEAETEDGRYWWAEPSLALLGPVPMPCPRGGSAA